MLAERILLLVDDEPNIVRALRRSLRSDGYRILTAESGEAGLALLEVHPVGVIVSDQRMPGMKGTEFLQRVKQRWPDTVRIVLSGYTDVAAVTEAINQGSVYKFLTKPWDDEVLRGRIREAFELHEQGDAHRRASADLERNNEQLREELVERGRQFGLQQRVLELSRHVLEQLPVGVAGIGGDGVIAVANRRFHQLLGVPRGSLLGRDAGQLPSGLHGADSGASVALSEPCRVERERLDLGGAAQGELIVLVPEARRNDP